MRRDTLFYQVFQQFPQALFELLDEKPSNAADYRFESVTVKETAFQLDGVFLPPLNARPGAVYFLEVQCQKGEQFYERFFSELFIFLYRHREIVNDWHAVVLYPTRKTEQTDLSLYQSLLLSPKVYRIYLDELGEIDFLPLNLIQLMMMPLREAPPAARQLAVKAKDQPAIIELLTTIMVYKFTNLSREEVRAMLGFTTTELKNTRFYQEVKEEGEEIGFQRGRQEGELEILIRQFKKRFGGLSAALEGEIGSLSQAQLESLAESIFDFNDLADVQAWLNTHTEPKRS